MSREIRDKEEIINESVQQEAERQLNQVGIDLSVNGFGKIEITQEQYHHIKYLLECSLVENRNLHDELDEMDKLNKQIENIANEAHSLLYKIKKCARGESS